MAHVLRLVRAICVFVELWVLRSGSGRENSQVEVGSQLLQHLGVGLLKQLFRVRRRLELNHRRLFFFVALQAAPSACCRGRGGAGLLNKRGFGGCQRPAVFGVGFVLRVLSVGRICELGGRLERCLKKRFLCDTRNFVRGCCGRLLVHCEYIARGLRLPLVSRGLEHAQRFAVRFQKFVRNHAALQVRQLRRSGRLFAARLGVVGERLRLLGGLFDCTGRLGGRTAWLCGGGRCRVRLLGEAQRRWRLHPHSSEERVGGWVRVLVGLFGVEFLDEQFLLLLERGDRLGEPVRAAVLVEGVGGLGGRLPLRDHRLGLHLI